MPKLFIQASNIHTGGGLTLLNQLIQDINFNAELFVDERSKNHILSNKNINIHFIKKLDLNIALYLKLMYRYQILKK